MKTDAWLKKATSKVNERARVIHKNPDKSFATDNYRLHIVREPNPMPENEFELPQQVKHQLDKARNSTVGAKISTYHLKKLCKQALAFRPPKPSGTIPMKMSFLADRLSLFYQPYHSASLGYWESAIVDGDQWPNWKRDPKYKNEPLFRNVPITSKYVPLGEGEFSVNPTFLYEALDGMPEEATITCSDVLMSIRADNLEADIMVVHV